MKFMRGERFMSKKLTVIATLFLVSFALVFAGILLAEDAKTPAAAAKSKFSYVGDNKCKICHKDEHTSWLTTVHAKAMDKLKPEEKTKADCLGCHTTGTDSTGMVLEGVQCESCHGPGSAYKTKTIMQDKKKSIEMGMTEPTKEVCIKCHNEKSPTFKGFDFDKYSKDEKAMHKKFPKKTAPAEEKKG
jgi:hypothetical protein